MLLKHIAVRIRPGHRERYLAAQRVWNRETARDPDSLGGWTAADPADSDVVHVLALWRSRAAYDRWMRGEHDRIAELAGAGGHIERIDVRLLEVESAHGALAELLEPGAAGP